MRFLHFFLISFFLSTSFASADNLTSLGLRDDGVTYWRLQNDGGAAQDVTLRKYGGGFEAVFTVAPGRLVVAGAGAGTYIAEFSVSGESRTKASGSQAFDACYHLGQCGTVSACSAQTVTLPVSVGQGALLDATGAILTDQTGLRPQWRWEGRPDTSVADLSDVDVLRPEFTPDVPGTYVAVLDLLADGSSDPAFSVTVEAGTDNLRPVARLQGRGLPNTGDLTLDGSDSFDVNGDAISYVWSVEAAPDGSALSLAGVAGPLVDVALDSEGDYSFGLTVQDAGGLTSGVACYDVTFTPGGNTDIWLSSYDQTLPNDGSDRVTFALGDVSSGPALDILIPSFDVNGGNENTFDTLTFTFNGRDYSLSSTRDFLDFVSFIEFDGDRLTDALISPNTDVRDFTLDFGVGRGSITLQNIVGNNLSRRQLKERSIDFYEGAFTRQAEPLADARFDQLILPVGAAGTLDPHGSTDIDGDPLHAQIGLTVAPVGSATMIIPAGEGLGTLSPDVAGDYLARVAVSDGLRTRFDTVLVTTQADAPVRPMARIAAGAANAAALGTPVALDGSQSYDFNGDLLSYEWTLIHAPQASLAAITDPGLPFAGLTPDVAGDYVVQLVVRDGAGASTPATALIRVPEGLPVAVAGPDLAAPAFGFVTLDGGLSSVGADARYDWALTGLVGDVDRAVTLTGDATSAIWTLEVLQPGDPQTAAPYAGVAQLIAADGNGVARPEAVFIGSGNLRPVVQGAGRIEAEAGVPVDLNAADYASDINGDALSHSWSLLYRPQGSAAQVDPANGAPVVTGDSLSFTADRAGIYLIQLTAEDGSLRATPAVILLEVTNSAPVAVATGPDQVFVGQVATLDGTGSFDPDGNALSYSWTIVSAPAGSTATIPDPFGPTASFTPDLRGAYSFGLVVSDFELSSDQAVVSLSVPNRAPVVLISGPDTLEAGVETLIDATGSTDPDGDVLSFVFEVTSAPTGADFAFAEVAPGQYGFVSQDAGDYTIEVTVSDGIDTVTEVLALSVVPGNTAPVLGPVRDLYTVELGLEFVLDLTASDADGDVLTFYATPLPLPTGVSFDANTGAIRFRPETGQEGQYQFTVGVSDGVLTDEAVLTIDVVPGTASDTAVFGRVLDAVDFANGVETPLAGMPVRLADSALMDMTDAEGRFRFGSLAEGRDRVFIEPSADGGPGGYIGVNRAIRITANQERDLAPDFLLTPLNDGCATVVAGQDTVLNGVQSGVTVTIAADTVQDSAGAAYTGEVCLGSLPELFQPASMPDTVQACRIYALDAPGAVFTQGIQITAPNVDALPEGARLSLWQVGTNTGRFRPSARGSVDAGATTVSATLTGAGGLFTFLPQAPVSRPSDDQPTGNRSLTVFEGDMSQTYALPGYRSFNRDQQVALSYHSTAADPTVIVAGDVTIAADASLPVTLDTNLDIGGLAISDLVQWTPREGADGSTPALVGEELTLRQSTPVDATGLPSGRYPYTFTTRANYACSSVGASHQGELYVQNETDSPYGKGWSIDGLQELVQNPDGSVAIIDNDTIATFDPKPTLTEFEDEPLVFPALGPMNSVVADFNSDGQPDIAFSESGTGSIGIISNFGNRDLRLDEPVVVADPNDVSEDPNDSIFPNLTAIASGQLTDDNGPDIAYTLQFENGYGFVENQGLGLFSENFKYLTEAEGIFSHQPLALDIVDVDEDGNEDIIYAALWQFFFFRDAYIRIDYGGDNQLGADNIQTVANDIGLQVAADDIDGDGRIDVAFRTREGVSFLFNEGNRNFTPVLSQLGGRNHRTIGKLFNLIDLNQDGYLDAIISTPNEIRIFLNDSGRSFVESAVTLPKPPPSDEQLNDPTPDEDGDGLPDYLSNAFVMDDANGDGILDIIMTVGSGVAVYAGDGNGGFAPFETGFVDYPFGAPVFADINGDGSLDAISVQRFSVTVHFSKPSDTGEFRSGAGEFSTLTKLPDGTWQRRYKDGNIIEFDANGLQTAEVDPQGNRREFAYGPDGRLDTITDQVGGVTQFTYDPIGRLTSVTYPDGRETLFTYDDAEGTLTEVTEPDGENIRYRYDSDGRLVAVTDQRGNTTEHQYSSIGKYEGTLYPNGSSIKTEAASSIGIADLNNTPQPLQYVQPDKRVTFHTDDKGGVSGVKVNEFGAVIETIDPLGRYTIITRNEDNLAIEVIRPTENDAEQQAMLDTRGLFGGIAYAQATTPDDIAALPTRVDEMEYDALGNITVMRMAVGTVLEREQRYEYEPDFNQISRVTDFDGFVMTYEYDEFGELIRVVDAEGFDETYTYNVFGLMETATDKRGNVTQYFYNDRFNVEAVVLPDGTVNRSVYDDFGNIIQQIQAEATPLQRSLIREFDDMDQIISEEVVDAVGISIDGKMFYEYDGIGNLVAVIDETGLRTEYVFDDMNQLVSEIIPGFGTTTFEYNFAGEMTAETDAEGYTVTYEYDIVGRTTKVTDRVGNISSFVYDVSDNLIQVIDGRNNVTNFDYDILERRIGRTNPIGQTIQTVFDKRDNLIQITRENGSIETATYDGLSRRLSVTTPDNVMRYAYDAQGNLITVSDDDSEMSMTYDNRNRLASVATNGTVGLQPETLLNYTYDNLSQRQTVTDNFGGVWSYNFDEKSRVESIVAPWGDTHSMDYDPAGRRLELANTTGRQTFSGYDFDRLTSLEHLMNSTPVARSGYAYAADGALRIERDLENPNASETLTYDAANRLLMVSEGVPTEDGGTPLPAEDYAYDETGNRTSSHISGTYTVDAHNRLLEDAEYIYAYDEKGNRTGRTRKSDGRVETYIYNSMNQLIAVSATDGLDVSYAYDAFGRRIAKTIDGVTTAYVYDIGSLYDITGHDRLLDFTDGVLTKRWLHGQNVDEPIAYEEYTGDITAGAGTAYNLHADRQGSVIAVTDQATGGLVARYKYDAFGQREQTVSGVTQDIGFTGREYDAETGLYYFRARHYDPYVGRFLQSDPLGFAAGDTNLYAYVWNDPANWTDPSGLKGQRKGRTAGGSMAAEWAGLTANVVRMGRSAFRPIGKATRCLANKVATAISGIARNMALGRDVSRARFASGPNCRTRVVAPRDRCSCRNRGGGAAGALIGAALGAASEGSSFVRGTEVLTPSGLVAIETLREGDLVVARDEETGQSLVSPVTAVMKRQATDVLWLTLEDGSGQVSRLGVTAEHPLFAVGAGWLPAGDVTPGDQIRDKDLQVLTVLAAESDASPQIVHNLEIEGPHTYFSGELEAWGHNAGKSNLPAVPRSSRDPKRCARGSLLNTVLSRDPNCVYCGAPSQVADHFLSHSHGGLTDEFNLRGCCRACNLNKSNMTPMEWWKHFNGLR
ncbi:PKD domain-containing protein [Parasulfitobacter algicola]|uniref:VCBS repeat-containing protein n=1 Tax=Parasulfitobacter algicola TaxID=2614809 RepID=A0ABX2J168_9RHOB|nr:RHS repeat-associated core domain-containing protein [Sulfitobacter algicola]NSX56968.1 VCBS repeat-containing protein [Sulfitobacter algicola]